MGHFGFICLHLAALLFFAVALFVTVPLHIVYSILAGRSGPASATRATHVICPTCRELVHKEATKCRHCGQALVPESVQFAQQRTDRVAAGKKWWQT
jgi:ribosomal protein L40E